ncbi:Kynurenine formamidase/cyclase-like [Fusarium oxysporum f. sp. vasinfectum]|nr:Kynurenine formamidase/cyclase-like [Fusarium oxysporum f. sp. vasinfectum]
MGSMITTSKASIHFQDYDSLPDPKRVWTGKPGSREEGLGRLVLLTPEVVANAASACIKTGRRTSLNWELTKLDIANFNRAPAQHHIVSLLNGAAYDDVYIFNPQQSSQWDGLRHFSAPAPTPSDPNRRLFYGGMTSGEIQDRNNTRIGIQHWAKEGICGRGVLLDYAEYARQQGVKFLRGDILFVRIGVVREWDLQMTAADKLAYAQSSNPQHAGVEGTEEMLKWIWNEGFSAVASDAISFEVYPPQPSYKRGENASVKGLFMHEYLIAGWGMPVGELFDLEGLSRICQEEQRWEFFITSAPLNMPGGVSTPPNCIAIF